MSQQLLDRLNRNGPAKLCATCRAIPSDVFFGSPSSNVDGNNSEPQEPIEYFHYQGHDARDKLIKSAGTGCELCRIFADALDKHLINEGQLYRPPARGISLSCHYCSALKVKLVGQEKDAYVGVRLTSLPLVDNVAERRFIAASELNRYYVLRESEADSPANLALVARWLDKCWATHSSCREALANPALPNRLLDVGQAPGSIWLCLSSDLEIPATTGKIRYAALSHCWGEKNKPPMTRKENLTGMLAGFPDALLPRTFFDAVFITRQLGLRYLWIDSLCIVQDDKAEVEQECARMNLVYANAWITFSASDARDCTDGLFASRTMQPVPLVWTMDDDTERSLVVFVYPSTSIRWAEEIDGPLQKRAWVLQERELSPRIIHYTKRCLMWECKMAAASEGVPRMGLFKDDQRLGEGKTLQTRRLLDRQGRTPYSTYSSEASLLRDWVDTVVHADWGLVVEQYSARNLSVPEDRLPGIAGMAAEWKRINPKDEYLAGLWQDDIFRGLMWFPCMDRLCKAPMPRTAPTSVVTLWPPPTKYRGIPSWSWASYDGPVERFEKNDENMYESGPDKELSYENGNYTAKFEQEEWQPKRLSIKLEAVSITVVGGNPFGHVMAGKLTLSGWSLVEFVSKEQAQESWHGWKYKLSPPQRPYEQHYDGLLVYLDYNHPSLPQTEVLLLQISRDIEPGRLSRFGNGLVLLQDTAGQVSAELSQQVYRRIGVFYITMGESNDWMLRRNWRTVTIV